MNEMWTATVDMQDQTNPLEMVRPPAPRSRSTPVRFASTAFTAHGGRADILAAYESTAAGVSRPRQGAR